MLTYLDTAWKWSVGFLSVAMTLSYKFNMPNGWDLNHRVPSSISVTIGAQDPVKQQVGSDKGEISLPVVPDGNYPISATAKVYLCESKYMGRCTMRTVKGEITADISAGTVSPALLSFDIPNPRPE